MSTSRTARPPQRHLKSLMCSVPVRRLKEILVHVIPNVTLGVVEKIPSVQLPRLYKLKMSDNRELLLSFAPSLAVRLLRQEGQLLSSEVTLVDFISGSKDKKNDDYSACETIGRISLGELLPKLLKHSNNNREMAYPYSIFEEPAGEPLLTLAAHLSPSERKDIDRQAGALTNALATLTSPTGTFGTVTKVLAYLVTGPTVGPQASTPTPTIGFNSWSEAFNTLLEGILRDGEDISVLLPYDTIRAHYERLCWHLDAVTVARLTILDVGNEANIMVFRGEDATITRPSEVKVTGLRSWSQGLFGDPLIADAFVNPSAEFLEGWRECGDFIELDKVGVRMLLYRCYRAVLEIVTEYYRPQADSSRKELEGRRKLTAVLGDLERIDSIVGSGSKRSRSPSDGGKGDVAKRPKLEMDFA
jgi:hypothetical protein